MGWVAYVDESIRAVDRLYILAAAVLDEAHQADAREEARTLALRGLPFHWRLEKEPRRAKAVGVVAGLPALHLVVVGAPLDPARQERARRHCLEQLLFQLDGAGVGRVWLETRTASLNSRDIAAVRAFRARRVIHHDIRVDHAYPSAEPLLWIPDIVAGAVSAAARGESTYREQLERLISEYRVRID